MMDPVNGRWRVGRKLGRTVYAMARPIQGPGDDDVLIGVFDTPELAAKAVADHNAANGWEA